jgi:hypothetical protein
MRVAAIGLYLLYLGFVGDKILDIVLDLSFAEPGSAPFVLSMIQLMLLIAISMAMAFFFVRLLSAPGPKNSGGKGKRRN